MKHGKNSEYFKDVIVHGISGANVFDMSIFNSNMGVLDVERLLVNQKKILEFLINGESVDDVNEYINTELRGASSYKIKYDKK